MLTLSEVANPTSKSLAVIPWSLPAGSMVSTVIALCPQQSLTIQKVLLSCKHLHFASVSGEASAVPLTCNIKILVFLCLYIMAQPLSPQHNSKISLLSLKGLPANVTNNDGARLFLHTARMSWTQSTELSWRVPFQDFVGKTMSTPNKQARTQTSKRNGCHLDLFYFPGNFVPSVSRDIREPFGSQKTSYPSPKSGNTYSFYSHVQWHTCLGKNPGDWLSSVF